MKQKIMRLMMCWISVSGVLLQTGCSNMLTRQVPKSPITMESVYNQAITGEEGAPLQKLRQIAGANRSASDPVKTLVADASQSTHFSRLANPDVPLYVYPHVAGEKNSGVPIPGYYSYFPLYTHVYYQFNP